MKTLNETLIGNLCLELFSDRLQYLVELLNTNIKPLKRADGDNVNIRAMYVVNDQINLHGGRLDAVEIERLAALLIDTPVLIGHDRARPPLARTFHAEIETANGQVWLKSYFYWPKPENGADELLLNIDSGLYKECSISFAYAMPACSHCGEDIRRCRHEIDPQAAAGDSSNVHFLYKDITQVFETSLVYKGAVRGTYITDKLLGDSRGLDEMSLIFRNQVHRLMPVKRNGEIGDAD